MAGGSHDFEIYKQIRGEQRFTVMTKNSKDNPTLDYSSKIV